MKHFVTYIIDCLGAIPAGVDYANPMNTIGMGNPALPTETTVGSGDLLTIDNKKRKFNRIKKYIKRKNKKVRN